MKLSAKEINHHCKRGPGVYALVRGGFPGVWEKVYEARVVNGQIQVRVQWGWMVPLEVEVRG